MRIERIKEEKAEVDELYRKAINSKDKADIDKCQDEIVKNHQDILETPFDGNIGSNNFVHYYKEKYFYNPNYAAKPSFTLASILKGCKATYTPDSENIVDKLTPAEDPKAVASTENTAEIPGPEFAQKILKNTNEPKRNFDGQSLAAKLGVLFGFVFFFVDTFFLQKVLQQVLAMPTLVAQVFGPLIIVVVWGVLGFFLGTTEYKKSGKPTAQTINGVCMGFIALLVGIRLLPIFMGYDIGTELTQIVLVGLCALVGYFFLKLDIPILLDHDYKWLKKAEKDLDKIQEICADYYDKYNKLGKIAQK
jgi:hypothetical protein